MALVKSLIEAAAKGDLSTLNRLIEDEKVNPSARFNEALIVASSRGHLDIVRRLLQDHRVKPNARNNDAIIVAAGEGHVDIVELLLKQKKVKASAQRNMALIAACQRGRFDVVDSLLNHGVDPSFPRNKAIIDATLNNQPWIVGRLLEDERVDPDAGMVVATQAAILRMVNYLVRHPRISTDVLYDAIEYALRKIHQQENQGIYRQVRDAILQTYRVNGDHVRNIRRCIVKKQNSCAA